MFVFGLFLPTSYQRGNDYFCLYAFKKYNVIETVLRDSLFFFSFKGQKPAPQISITSRTPNLFRLAQQEEKLVKVWDDLRSEWSGTVKILFITPDQRKLKFLVERETLKNAR